jgi:hypothetical protein
LDVVALVPHSIGKKSSDGTLAPGHSRVEYSKANRQVGLCFSSPWEFAC